MAGIEKIGKVEEDEAVKLSVELKEKLALEENQKLAKQEEMWRKLEEEIEYYKRIILKKVESTLISEDHAPYYRGGVDQIRWINEGIRKDDKLAKRFALNLLRNLLQKHGITRGYIKCTESDVPLDFLKLLSRLHPLLGCGEPEPYPHYTNKQGHASSMYDG
nr:unnamed protein product [Digitaria exilis]